MILELTRLGALYRPVTRIVDARRHLVGEQRPVNRKQLQRQYAYVLEPIHETSTVIDRECSQFRSYAGCRRRRHSQNPFAVDVLDRRIEHLSPCLVASSDNRQLVLEGHIALDQQWCTL